MTGIFPAADDDGCRPMRDIAARWQCDEDIVHAAFRGVSVPEYDTPGHLDQVKATTHTLNAAARHAKNLCREMAKLDEQERLFLRTAGSVTVEQVEHLATVLAGDAKGLDDWLRKRNRQGGRNPAAYAIAEGMRRLLRRLKLKITYGATQFGEPSTDFCRAVEHGIGAFGVSADWRGPAKEAIDKQNAICGRLSRISANCHERLIRTQK